MFVVVVVVVVVLGGDFWVVVVSSPAPCKRKSNLLICSAVFISRDSEHVIRKGQIVNIHSFVTLSELPSSLVLRWPRGAKLDERDPKMKRQN